MISVKFVNSAGRETTVETDPGSSAMKAAVDNGVAGILADCGGSMSCATCHVHVHPDWMQAVGPASSVEAEMLEMAIDPDETSRLSCQIFLNDSLNGLVLLLPPSQV
jgi:2Fe-2S ferredoxin